MKILFRTSGGAAPKRDLGLGHIYRSINLALALKNNDIHFLIQDFGGVKKILQKRGFKKISLLKKGIKLDDEIKKTVDYIVENEINILIIDKYIINIRFLRNIRKLVKTVVISDLRKFNFPSDLVVNGFIGFKNKSTTNSFGAKCLLGSSYQILDNRFCNNKKFNQKKNFLLVTFGGYDENHLIEVFLNSSKKYLQKFKIKIILGVATTKSPIIQNYQRKYKKNLTVIEKTTDMYREVSESSFGLCSGGMTSYEFASTRTPFAIICQVKHQMSTAKIWESLGVATNLGLKDKNTQKKIQNFLDAISQKKIVINKSIIDGCGSIRVAKEVLSLK